MADKENRHLHVVAEADSSDSWQPNDGGIPQLWDHPIVFEAQKTQDDDLLPLDNYDEMRDTLENGGQLIVHYLNDQQRRFSPELPHLVKFFTELKKYHQKKAETKDPASQNAAYFIRKDLEKLLPSLRNKEALVKTSNPELDLVEGTSKEFLFKILLNLVRWGEDHLKLNVDFVGTRKEVIEWYLKSDTYGQLVISRVDLKVH